MHIIKIFITSLILIFSMNGCQGTNSDESVTTDTVDNASSKVPTVILIKNQAVATINSQIITIDVRVISADNSPYPDGNVKIIYPDDVKYGRDVGSFTTLTAAVVNGVARFEYTAPSRLEDDTSDIVFKFYHENNPSQAVLFTVKIVPDVDQIVLNNYVLKSSLLDGNTTIGLNSSKLMSFYVEDNAGVMISDTKVSSITIEILNPILGQLEDAKDNIGKSLTVTGKNSVTVKLKTNTVSGLLPLKVKVSFFDENNKQQTLTKTFTIVVLSGPPSAVSFSYVSSDSQAKQNDSKMIEHWVITVTDRYNNLVNTNPAVSMGAMVGYVQSSPHSAANIGNYLYYDPSYGVDGSMSSATNTFRASADVFDNVDQTNDYLVTFGNGYTYNASGKWDINTNSSNTLDLKDTYEGNNTRGLGFAVGNNYRQDRCLFGVEWVANVYPEEEGNYIIDDTGSKRIIIEYDYYLVGKSIVVWVNFVGKQYETNATVKIGEAKKITLRGVGLHASFTYPRGFEGVIHLPVMINGTSEYYRNANFGATIAVTGEDENWTVIGTSMGTNSNGKNITIRPPVNYQNNTMFSCKSNNGIAYVDINFTSPSPDGGTVSLGDAITWDEF